MFTSRPTTPCVEAATAMERLPSAAGHGCRLDAFFQQLVDEHRGFLRDVAEKTARAMQDEDRRMMEKIARKLHEENHRLAAEVRALGGSPQGRSWGRPESPREAGSDSTALTSDHSGHVRVLQVPPGSAPRPATADVQILERQRHPAWGGVAESPKATAAPPSRAAWDESGRGAPKMFRFCERAPTAPEEGLRQLALAPPLRGVSSLVVSDVLSLPDADGSEGDFGDGDFESFGGPAVPDKAARSMAALAPAAHIKENLKRKQRRRLRYLFRQPGNVQIVTAEMMHKFFERRFPDTSMDLGEVVEVVEELRRVRGMLPQATVGALNRARTVDLNELDVELPTGHIELGLLVELVLEPQLPSLCVSSIQEDVEWCRKALSTVGVEEIIDNATMLHHTVTADDEEDDDIELLVGNKWKLPTWPWILNTIVSVTVLFNIVCLGASLDYNPSSKVWFVIEIVCTMIFVLEVVVNLGRLGIKGYFTCKEKWWNMLDMLISAMSVIDVAFAATATSLTTKDGAARMVIMLRALRLTRVVRLVKLLRTPMLSNLANMLTGFFLGVPALFWVVVLFFVVLFVLGLAFRIMWGPAEGQDLISICGRPDLYSEEANTHPACTGRVHWMYGEEFFGTVGLSMFTTFRFMLGDYQSKTGTSLAIVFGEGYGAPFHIMFGVGMILVVFGLFNIVTAIFVDSTISGLKRNDVMRKYVQLYEGRYVKMKMLQLLHRVGELVLKKPNGRVSTRLGSLNMHSNPRTLRSGTTLENLSRFGEVGEIENIQLTKDDFVDVMDDAKIRGYLRDLDVEIYNSSGLFETFDSDEDGTVSIPELVQAIMRLRGEVRKNDLIASWVAVRALARKFEDLTLALGNGQLQRECRKEEEPGGAMMLTHSKTRAV